MAGIQKEFVKCNLCGADDYAVVWKGQETGLAPKDLYSSSKGVMSKDTVVRCNRCGLMYVNPRFKSKTIVDAYAEAEDEVYISQAENRMDTFRRGLDFVEKSTGIRGGKLLDVGCAAGFFLNVARDRGWKVAGVEPNRWLVKWGNEQYGLSMKAATMRGAHFPASSFDVITMWDVLEHTPDPDAELKEAHRLLRKGGYLLVNIPDSGSSLARVFGRRWWFVLSVHLFYFTSKTLRRMLEKNGFKVAVRKRYFQTLSLGYLIRMLKHLAKNPFGSITSDTMGSVARVVKMERFPITYYAGQTLFLVRKE